MIVFDASVFAKLFLVQEDRAKAEALIEHLLTKSNRDHCAERIHPRSSLHRVASRCSVQAVLELLSNLRASGLTLDKPTVEDHLRAEKIDTTGHAKSGYPALN